MARIINDSDVKAFANVLANAILDRKEILLDKEGIVQVGTTAQNKQVSATEIEDLAIGIIHSLRNARVNEKVVITKTMKDFFKSEYQPQITAITNAMTAHDDSSIEDTLEYLSQMSHQSMHFDNNEVVAERFNRIGAVIMKASDEQTLLPQEILDSICNFRDILELRKERFLGGKNSLDLPMPEWESHKKAKTLTSEMRGQLVDDVLNSINGFLRTQKELSTRLSEQAKSPELVRYISPSPSERVALLDTIKNSSKPPSEVDDEEVPTPPEESPPPTPMPKRRPASEYVEISNDFQEVRFHNRNAALLEQVNSIPYQAPVSPQDDDIDFDDQASITLFEGGAEQVVQDDVDDDPTPPPPPEDADDADLMERLKSLSSVPPHLTFAADENFSESNETDPV
jgi:hypothetical protein